MPLAWIAIMGGGLGAVYAAIALGAPHELSLNLVAVAAGALLLILERLMPEERGWMTADGQWWHDLGHLFLGFALGSFGGAALARAVVPAPVWTVWPASWPMALQVALGLVMAEFFGYWQHRALHRIPALWHWHALHHSTGRMTFFKTTRIHAIDIGSFMFLSIAPMLAAGAPLAVVLWVTAFGNFAALTQHSNVRLRTPSWLNAVLGTPAVHWLHHSVDKQEGDSNFGMNVMVWDHVFGTYLAPPAEPRAALGIDPDHVPPTFLGQLLLPWRTVRDLTTRS